MTLGRIPNEPRAAEMAYTRELSTVWRQAQSLIAHGMNRLLAAWPAPEKLDANPLTSTPKGPSRGELPTPYAFPAGIPKPPSPSTVTTKAVRAQVSWMRKALRMLVNRKTLAPILGGAALRFDRFATAETRRALKQDANVFGLPDGQLLLDWARENVALIESGIRGPSDGVRLQPLADDVAEVIVEAFAQGARRESVAALLVERFKVSDSRAHLIARDQSTKLTGQLNKQKQTAAGVEEYVWVTEDDEQVRAEHAKLHNTRQRWDKPPPPGHPGEDINCRCRARPVLPDF